MHPGDRDIGIREEVVADKMLTQQHDRPVAAFQWGSPHLQQMMLSFMGGTTKFHRCSCASLERPSRQPFVNLELSVISRNSKQPRPSMTISSSSNTIKYAVVVLQVLLFV